ncbi:hypothetical protein GTZ99_02845 [Novosphingobium sp. FSY-8]|uniref:Phage shock protein B n=1 Tax=Novosphingobium ovatum TaxID=1908523 RepID=A0ABW9XAC9_9SPHN|nr:hypothetical protein [Novosphingobium ovatum]NBC35489.1 hypothetical protein [Novosphingobium ovatum]
MAMFWSFLIPMLALSIPIVAIVTKHRQRIAEIAAQAAMQGHAVPPQLIAAQTERLRELEERVRVLERILTDERQSRDLAAQIENLR